MDLTIQGKGKVTLAPGDFKAAGGEGAIFIKNGVAHKLYGQTDANGKFIFHPKKMIAPGKLQELAALTNPAIIKPENVILDGHGTPVGYTMRALPDTVALCQIFTRAYRDRHHLTPDHLLKLVQKLQAGVRHVHDKGLLIVDLNEMNFLLDPGHSDLFFIDVDSYQTPHFPATAIMDSIRDRHATTFTTGTDWFSFGIISFQMLVGIHPYKGKHDKFKTLDARMQANVSVLNATVKIPAVCAPFTVVPQAYRDWYEAVFERGERTPPPDNLIPVVVLTAPTVKRITGSDTFRIETVGTSAGAIVAVVGANVLTTCGVYAGAHRLANAAPGSVLGITPQQNLPVLARVENNRLVLTDVRRKLDLPLSLPPMS